MLPIHLGERCMEPLILNQLLYCVKLLHPAHLTSEPNKKLEVFGSDDVPFQFGVFFGFHVKFPG